MASSPDALVDFPLCRVNPFLKIFLVKVISFLGNQISFEAIF